MLFHSSFFSGTVKLNISRLRAESVLHEAQTLAGSKWSIDCCVHEAEEELRLGEMVLRSGDSSISTSATHLLSSVITKMVTAAGDKGYHLADSTRCGDVGTIATVAAATAVYRQGRVLACGYT